MTFEERNQTWFICIGHLKLLGDNVSFLFIRYVRSQPPSHTRACIYIWKEERKI